MTKCSEYRASSRWGEAQGLPWSLLGLALSPPAQPPGAHGTDAAEAEPSPKWNTGSI